MLSGHEIIDVGDCGHLTVDQTRLATTLPLPDDDFAGHGNAFPCNAQPRPDSTPGAASISPLQPRNHRQLYESYHWHSPSATSTGPYQAPDTSSTQEDVYILPFSLGQAISLNTSPLPDPIPPVTAAEKTYLIYSYLQETGTWCETTDSEMHFTVKSIHPMMNSKAFVAAAMALASRQLDTVKSRDRQMTLELYQYIIQLLIRQDPAEADASIFAACTLLCVYEMMVSEVLEWRRHLKVCPQNLVKPHLF